MNLLRDKRVDALMLYDSYYSSVEAAGMPLRYLYHPLVENFGNNGYFATEKTIEQKGDALGHFARAIAKATAFVFANPEAGVKIYWQVNPSGKIGATEAAAMARTLKDLKGDMKDFDPANNVGGKYGAPDMARFQIYMKMMLDEGAISKPVPVDDLVTDKFIPMANDFDVEKIRAMAKAWK
jgi:NitT/TauT family transport system substrate-binding protein